MNSNKFYHGQRPGNDVKQFPTATIEANLMVGRRERVNSGECGVDGNGDLLFVRSGFKNRPF